MKLTFHGGAKMVTGVNFLLEAEGLKILIDCGLFQESSFAEEKNYEPFPYDPKEISFVFVTHAHLDHIGRLPGLYREGFRGKIFSTPPTRDFAELMLIDSEKLLVEEGARHGHKPIWSHDDVWGMMRLAETVDYRKTLFLGKGVKATLFNSGHILGSSYILIDSPEGKVVFTGDIGNSPLAMLNPPDPLPEVQYAVVESVYGDRTHPDVRKRQEVFEDIVEAAVKAGGTLMIPAFAMERTQELLYELNALVEKRKIPRLPIFLDSPLAIKATEIYRKYPQYLGREAKRVLASGDELFRFPGLEMTLTKEESKKINNAQQPKIVIAGSGMSQGGRILHHEYRYLPDPKSTLLTVGYQAPGSRGREILNGATEVEIFGERIPVRCRIQAMAEYSAHADQGQIISWLEPIHQSLKKIFIVQGEPEASEALAVSIRDLLATEAHVPNLGETVSLGSKK